MRISRVQVEEGFLDGLDVEFAAGLNVIIGARGTGKTSLIELIRYCLDVPGFSTDFTAKSLDHARAILGPGQVSVSIVTNEGAEIIVSRSIVDAEPSRTSVYAKPMILSQTEIENIGLLPESRLRLIDGFINHTKQAHSEESRFASEVRSYTIQISEIRNEIEQLEREASQLPDIERQIGELVPQERSIEVYSDGARQKNLALSKLSEKISVLSVRNSEIEGSLRSVEAYRTAIDRANTQSAGILQIRETNSLGLQGAPISVERARGYVAKALLELEKVQNIYSNAQQRLSVERLNAENEARSLRRDIEKYKEGAGAVARQAQLLRERRAHIFLCQDLLDQKRRRFAEVARLRVSALNKIEQIRDARFEVRESIVKTLNKALAPSIKLEIERSGQTKAYSALLVSLLRGSGVRYNEIVPVIVKNVSPRELLEWVEEDNAEALGLALNLPRDRASRLLTAFRAAENSELGVVLVEDDVRFFLLDGSDFKGVDKISTGQRCTVVLPIILEQHRSPLIIDQPEDHIDNAFIANILAKAMNRRSKNNQIIVTTHNPNIPVLGDAEEVIQLGSDGRRGYVLMSGSLNEPATVNAISNVMEGGAAAFRQRVRFYGKNPANGS